MASHLHRLSALAALGLAVIIGPQALAAADKGANAAAPASASSAKAQGPSKGRVAPPARPILGANLTVMPGERCAEIKKGPSQRRSVTSCERRPRGHGHDGRPD
jgi:hypothetical protein